jgi:hypothetical protein
MNGDGGDMPGLAIEEARYQHEWILELIKGLFLLSTSTLRLLFALTSGSAAAMLVFMGHLAASGQGAKVKDLTGSLCVFALSAFLVTLSMGTGYVTQLIYLNSESGKPPKVGHIVFGVAITIAVFAYVSYFIGIFIAYCAFSRFQ